MLLATASPEEVWLRPRSDRKAEQWMRGLRRERRPGAWLRALAGAAPLTRGRRRLIPGPKRRVRYCVPCSRPLLSCDAATTCWFLRAVACPSLASFVRFYVVLR